MFIDKEFRQLYQLLDYGMVDVDCGIKCGRFCCVGDRDSEPAFKYLLPGEVEHLVMCGFHEHAVLEDFGFLIHYRAIKTGSCACENIREHRPFCCRVFPFRPEIDISAQRVVGLWKTESKRFLPCWIDKPSEDWKQRAIRAWNMLFSDRTYLEFYARYYLCLKESEKTDLSFVELIEKDEGFREKMLSLQTLPIEHLWSMCKSFFAYID
ncbi:MAG: hypothetical protein JNN15_06965 [Blastocatellia bacterium]|nr:hypothetical protein [Blastocatellia bacterium]